MFQGWFGVSIQTTPKWKGDLHKISMPQQAPWTTKFGSFNVKSNNNKNTHFGAVLSLNVVKIDVKLSYFFLQIFRDESKLGR